MGLQNLLNQFVGSANSEASSSNQSAKGLSGTLSQLSSHIPGGLAGGAAAGGIVALLMSNKSARKFAGTAATMGGAAVLGGLAYKAFRNWQESRHDQPVNDAHSFTSNEMLSAEFQLSLIKAMIAAAKADGRIDETEQQRIYDSIDSMDLPIETRGLIFDLIRNPISIREIASGAHSMEQKSELYLLSCLMTDPDHPAEQAHLQRLAYELQLPSDLAQQLQLQAQQTMAAS